MPPCRAIEQKDGIYSQLYPHTAYYCEDSNRAALALCPFAFTTAPASHIKEQRKGKLSFVMQHIIKISYHLRFNEHFENHKNSFMFQPEKIENHIMGAVTFSILRSFS